MSRMNLNSTLTSAVTRWCLCSLALKLTPTCVDAVRIDPVVRRWVRTLPWRLRLCSVWQQSTAAPQTFSMPVTVQSSNQSPLQFSSPGNALVTTSDVASPSLTDAHLLSPQQPALQRNTVSPGLPQRPASAGEQMIQSWMWGQCRGGEPLVHGFPRLYPDKTNGIDVAWYICTLKWCFRMFVVYFVNSFCSVE